MTHQEAKLPNLPASGDEFWEHSDTELQRVQETKECEHFFVHQTATEVSCKTCKIGFYLSPGWIVLEGNLVDPGGVVVRLQGSSLVNG
jgi:hypothetical protein